MNANPRDFTWEGMRVRLDRANGTDLDVVNAARRSFGTKSYWHRRPLQSGGVGELKQADSGLIDFLSRGLSAADFDKFILDIAAAGWRLHEEAHQEEYDAEIYGDKLKELVSRMWAWRDEAIHDTPFNHVGAHFSIMVPMFVARQLGKTEYMPWSEISRRYKEEGFSYWKPGLSDGMSWRATPENKKQGSGGPVPEKMQKLMDAAIRENTEEAHDKLLLALDKDVCMEQARMFLPQNLMVEVTWSGFLGAICKMLRERTGTHAQAETQWVAKEMRRQLMKHFPVSVAALVR